MEIKKVLVAMSGGVDSSVAAYLCREAGYDCEGAMMRLYVPPCPSADSSPCRTQDDTFDAHQAAQRLCIPFHIFDARMEFEDKVISKFIRCYECGLTPNPCIDCNRHLKFDHFLTRAMALGCTHVVTGHYARIRFDADTGRYLLYRAADCSKDQSYVLSCLTQEQLSHTLLPLGELSKSEVRRIAESQGLLNARKKDSQDICFVPDGDYVAFMQRHTGKQYTGGDYLDLQGNVVGRHKGAVGYTLGQRRGLGIAMGAPVYVCGKNMQHNTVTVGPSEALFSTTLLADDWNWIPFPALTGPISLTAKARYNQLPQPATVYPGENGSARVVFEQPQRALTPGQAVVLYDGDLVVGGGTITGVLRD